MDFHMTAKAIGLPIDGDVGTLSNSGPVMKSGKIAGYGVNIKSRDNWRGRHNAKKVVKIRTVKPFNTFSLGAAQ